MVAQIGLGNLLVAPDFAEMPAKLTSEFQLERSYHLAVG